MPEERDHEPVAALAGGPGGLRTIKRLLVQAPAYLSPTGAIFMEIGYDQGQTASDTAQKHFPAATIIVHQDLAGLDRLLEIQT